MQLCLQKTIWLSRLLSQYTKLHTVTPPYPQYASYIPNRSPQKLLTTLTKLIVLETWSHYTTVDHNPYM